MDTSNVKIEILPQTETFDEVRKSEVKKQEQTLQEKYKNYRKSRGK